MKKINKKSWHFKLYKMMENPLFFKEWEPKHNLTSCEYWKTVMKAPIFLPIMYALLPAILAIAGIAVGVVWVYDILASRFKFNGWGWFGKLRLPQCDWVEFED